MTNETNGLSSAILGLVAAFEAERKAFEIAYKIMEERIVALESRIGTGVGRADWIETRIDGVSTRLDWLDKRFEEEAAGISARLVAIEGSIGSDMTVNAAQRIDARIEDLDNRVVSLETANRIRAEIAGTDDDRHDDLVAKLDELERTVERIDGRVDDLENREDLSESAVRDLVESLIEGSTISINL